MARIKGKNFDGVSRHHIRKVMALRPPRGSDSVPRS